MTIRNCGPVSPSPADLCPVGNRESDEHEGAGGDLDDEGGGEEELVMEEEQEEQPNNQEDSAPKESAQAKVIRDPGLPTKQEIDEHNITHCPFRAWCPHCVAGKAKEDPHWRVAQEIKETGVPVVSSDYCFVGQDGEEGNAVILVTRDHRSRFTFSHQCPSKSCAGDHWRVKRTEEDIQLLGYSTITYRVDNEPAILELQEKVRDLRTMRNGAQTLVDNTPPKHSKSAGPIEKGVQEVEEQIRTLKLALEERIQCRISITSLVFQWLVEYASVLINRFSIGHDGKTPYSRLKGRSSRRPLAEFGECIFYKVPKSHGRLLKLEPRWRPGVWIGIDQRTNEAIIGTDQGTVKARSIRRRPSSSRWVKEEINKIRGSPRDPAQEPSPHHEASSAQDAAPPPQVHRPDVEPEVPPPRQLYITKRDLTKYGYTVGCQGCIAMEHGRQRKPHSETCRKRIRDAMLLDPDDKFKVELEEARAYSYMEKVHERNVREDEKRKQAAQPDVQPEAAEPGAPHRPEDPEEEDEEREPKRPRRREAAASSSSSNITTNSTVEDTPSKSAPAPSQSASSSGTSTTGTNRKRHYTDELQEALQEHETDFDYMKDGEKQSQEQSVKRMKTIHQMMLKTLGREHVHVAEIFSPPRVTSEARRRGLQAGAAFDKLCGWDATRGTDVKAMLDYIDMHQPMFVNGSPPCTLFSQLQNLTKNKRDEDDFQRRLEEARHMLRVAVAAYNRQVKSNRFFLHEHPLTATSWAEPEMQRLLATPGVYFIRADQCQFGLSTWTAEGEQALVMKPTGFLTNSPALAMMLNKQCDHSHVHQQLLEGRAGPAAIYPEKLVSAIVAGIAEEASKPRTMIGGIERIWSNEDTQVFDITKSMKELCGLHAHCDDVDTEWEQYHDSVSGQPLEPGLVRNARAEEIRYLHQYNVYKKVPISVMHDRNGKLIDTRWVDVNKGDNSNKNYRSRIVAREIKKDSRQDLFAATPPLMSMRMLISECASSQDNDYCLLFLDISRAYFNAAATRDLFIKIPDEDYEPGDEYRVGLLLRSLYGTRDAAQNWENEYSSFLTGLGFTQGLASPCHFAMVRNQRKIQIAVHGDDFSCAGNIHDLRWLARQFENRYEVKQQLVGPKKHHDCVQKARVLNRLITWEETGISYEADPRHAEMIIAELGLQDANAVKTPGEVVTPPTQPIEMEPTEASRFRGIAARAMYLSLDRPDIAFAAKEAARSMAKPMTTDWNKLKRLGRFLVGQPRLVMKYPWQANTNQVVGLSDADWAGDKESRKSTSGGAILRGSHLLHFWSNTQSIIATSSGESELYALTRCASQVLGVMSFASDMGMVWQGSVLVDSSAAIAIAHRRGLQKLRHVHVQFLWIQQKVRDQELSIHKIDGKENAADGMTKHVPAELCQQYMTQLSLEYRAERHELAPRSVSALPHHRGSSHSKDFWVETPTHWIRNHVIPRSSLFTPMNVEGGPAASDITDCRVTWMQGATGAHHDCWTGKDAHAVLHKKWVGATVFSKTHNHGMPGLIAAVDVTTYAATHVSSSDATHITTCTLCSAPCALPLSSPIRKRLAGGSGKKQGLPTCLPGDEHPRIPDGFGALVKKMLN